MNGITPPEPDSSEFVEVDPTGRYGRYDEILGKGASKTVYRAFDEYEGIEVAWNQVKLNDFLQSPEDLERLYCEIHLLKTLKHNNIMKFYTSWVDTTNRNINFVTEMFTSGTLRQYRLKHKRVNIRALKHWCRQILKGLLYLHSLEPPVIHRDLKCDNIFVNGHQGEVKIGDLGLAAILRKSHAARCVGTPEFMAPEVYAEEYNELVDIYAFGMCILEMVTFEYPYSECNHPAQIYKKVISGKKPEALYKVKDPEVRQFVEKCLATVSLRLPARELLMDPFLQIDYYGHDLRPIDYYRDFDEVGPVLRQPLLRNHHSFNSSSNGYYNFLGYETEMVLKENEIALFTCQEDDHLGDVDITIKGRRIEDDSIFLRLRIADKEGRVRNIYFPFDIETDTATSVATEMVDELDITDQDVTKIADMIDGEIALLVPEWKRSLNTEETPHHTSDNLCHNCASNAMNLQVLQCSRHGCASIHGRFEEITYQFEGSEQCITEDAPVVSSQSDVLHYADIWGQPDEPESTSPSRDFHSDNEHEPFYQSSSRKGETESKPGIINSPSLAEEYENEIRQELRWLKAKYQMQLRELRDQQLGILPKSPSTSLSPNNKEQKEDNGFQFPSIESPPKDEKREILLKSFGSGKHFSPNLTFGAAKKCGSEKVRNYEATYGSCSPEEMVTAKSFYTGTLRPYSLHRATSLPVDAIDF